MTNTVFSEHNFGRILIFFHSYFFLKHFVSTYFQNCVTIASKQITDICYTVHYLVAQLILHKVPNNNKTKHSKLNNNKKKLHKQNSKKKKKSNFFYLGTER